MAKTYSVDLPVSGYLTVEVQADDEDEAIEKALAADYTIDDLTEWNAHEHLVQGNFFYGSLSRARAEMIDDGEDDD